MRYAQWMPACAGMTQAGSRGLGGRGTALLMVLWLALGMHTAQAQQTVTREAEYTYNASTGLLELERVDPGGTQCIETRYQHDAFGNRRQIEVRPCATTVASASFTPRVTLNEFEASTDANNLYPANAYQTRTRSGTGTGAAFTALTEARATYDPRFGAAVSQTAVALADAAKNVSQRTVYDGFGRVQREVAPVKRNADGSVVESSIEYATVYCQGAKAVANAACLSFNQLVPVSFPSKRLVDASGNVATSATVSFVTAYFIEATPRDSAGSVIGSKSRVHYDALHRVIAKESQAYDGRWVRTLTGYDQLGLVAAQWAPHFTDTTGTPAFNEQRQWTAARDLLHRPVEQRQYFRAKPDDAATEVRALVTFNGLETIATVPADSSPDGTPRTATTRKNATGKTAQTENADGATLNMAYDPVGNLVRTVDALGNATIVTYTPGTARFKTGLVDPDQGAWTYNYDALGQLKTQTDARLKTVTMAYDDLGRLKTKSTPAFTASWFYDKTEAGVWCAAGLNRLCESKSGNSPAVTRQKLGYDTLGRATSATTTLDRAYISRTSFDGLGRVASVTYPTGFAVKYAYSAVGGARTPGVLERVSDNANAARVFWRIDTLSAAQVFDARGNFLKTQLGNGVLTDHRFDPVSGKAFNLRGGTGGTVNVFDQRYEYDKAHNLAKRTDGLTGVIETFAYDVLERLTQTTLSSASDAGAAHTIKLKYNALGNILEKSDLGGYSYTPGDKPHAVRTAGGTSYVYDANGNIQSASGMQSRTHVWNDFNQPESMALGGNKVEFSYDADLKRVKEITTSWSTKRTLFLVHPDNAGGLGFEREETRVSGSLTRNESRHYISVGGGTVVVKTLNDAGAVDADPNLTHYWHKDVLGSIVAVTNASGAVVERMAFDAWGRRLRSSGRVDPSVDPANGNRGYTGHEHLDELGLVHMNGRVYDPVLARFLSPDSIVEAPEMLQSYNRYTYVLNNPLKYTDPSGHCIWDYCIAEIAAFVIGAAMAHEGNQYWRMVGSVMMMWGGAGLTEAGLGSAATGNNPSAFVSANTFDAGGFGNAFVSAAGASLVSSGGDVGQALKDGMFAMAFNWAGGQGSAMSGKRLALHALIGCAEGAASHGECGPSAMAAVVGKAATGMSEGLDGFSKGMATAVAGGTASVIGGGKFANGAYQAGFGYLFNYCAHADRACFEDIKGSIASAWNWLNEPTPGCAQYKCQTGMIPLPIIGIGSTAASVDAIQLTKSLASEAQVAEILAGGGVPIAGAGTSTALKDAPRLAATYGGQVSDWSKITSSVYKAADGVIVETHAYMNAVSKKIVEFKSKVGF